MTRVIIESPLAGNFVRNIRYARLCMFDCLERGEAPYASHLLYPQVYNDRHPGQREAGIAAGLAWSAVAEVAAIYLDLGLSDGMKRGIERHRQNGLFISERRLPERLMRDLDAPTWSTEWVTRDRRQEMKSLVSALTNDEGEEEKESEHGQNC